MKQKWLSLLLIFLLLGICGCSSVSDATPTIEPSATPAPSPTFTITPTPLPTETPTATPTPGPLSASEVFDRISPSIAYIETAAFSGSGLLFEGGYVLTNAHVVWPYNKVRVVFPDGSEFLDTPVVAWDLLADLAVLGPIETNLTPIQLTDGEDRVIGSDVYLIGYPGEVDAFPTPTISRGLISHMREWVLTGISYFQTEAALAGGQSGGVLVTDQGEVIGISGLRFTEADFGIIASAADLIPRIQKLLDRESLGDIDARKIAQEGGQHTHLLTIKPGETAILTVDMVAGEQIDFEINGDDFYWFDLVDPAGTFLLSTEDNATINQSNSGKATFDGLHFLVIGQDYRVNMNSSVSLSSNQVLKLYSDIDDNKSLKLGQTYYGSLDYPSDYDRFLVRLNAGENIHVNVESVLIDPFVWIGYVGAGDEQAAWDDDSGKGVLGADAEVSYSAPHSGMYELYVSDSYGIQSGGYALTVDIWQQGQPTPVVPEPTPTPIISQFGYMQLFENESLRFELEVPFYLIEAPDLVPESFQDICIQDATCLVDPSSGLLLTFAESDLVLWGAETVDELADADIKFMVDQLGAVLEGRDKVVTSGGTELIVMRYEFYGMTIERLVTISQQTGLTISYIFLTDEVPKLGPVAEYSLSTFELIK